MMRWKVMLPKEKSLWLESDTPHEALEKLGYDNALVLSRNDVASSTDDVTAWITNIFADS